MVEAIFEVREVIISPCDHPTCSRWATREIRLLGASTWEFQRVCGYHARWAKRQLVEPAGARSVEGGEGEP